MNSREKLVKDSFVSAAKRTLKYYEMADEEDVEERRSCVMIVTFFKQQLRNVTKAPALVRDVHQMQKERRIIAQKWAESKDLPWHKATLSDQAYFVDWAHRELGEPLAKLRLEWVQFLVAYLEREAR